MKVALTDLESDQYQRFIQQNQITIIQLYVFEFQTQVTDSFLQDQNLQLPTVSVKVYNYLAPNKTLEKDFD